MFGGVHTPKTIGSAFEEMFLALLTLSRFFGRISDTIGWYKSNNNYIVGHKSIMNKKSAIGGSWISHVSWKWVARSTHVRNASNIIIKCLGVLYFFNYLIQIYVYEEMLLTYMYENNDMNCKIFKH